MKELVGKKVLAIYVDKDDQTYLKFDVVGHAPIVYQAEGDCCSESWFYHVLGVDCLIGHVVEKCEEDQMDDDLSNDGLARQEVDRLYKITLTTERGYCDIEFRNSSNGYYGGNVALHEHDEFSWNYTKPVKHRDWTYPINWQPIQADWTHSLKE